MSDETRIAELEAACAAKDEALRRAIHVIRACNSVGLPDGGIEEECWRLYQSSPEMKIINAALASDAGRALLAERDALAAKVDELHSKISDLTEQHKAERDTLREKVKRLEDSATRAIVAILQVADETFARKHRGTVVADLGTAHRELEAALRRGEPK